MRLLLISAMKKVSLLCMIFISVSLFSGCVTSQQPQITPPGFDPAGYKTLRIDARKLQIIENWQMPMEPPYIEHTLEPTMSGFIVEWASRVLIPVGGSGELILNISKASVTVSELPKSADLASLFKNQQESKVRAEVKARLMWIQPIGDRHGTIEIDASASITVPETATPNDYDVAVRRAMLDAITQMDDQVRMKTGEIPRLVLP
jgi:hypothetical protein